MDAWSYGEELRTTLVCVDSYDDGVLRGRFYNPYLLAGTTFLSLSQFLQEFEQALDHIDFPKAFTITRTFATPQTNRNHSHITMPCRQPCHICSANPIPTKC